MPAKKIRILLIEDDPDQVHMYKTQFKVDGFEVFHCMKCLDLLSLLKNKKIDIILLDIILGTESGEDILRELKDKGITDKIPVIIFSNLKGKDDQKRYLKMGARDYWPKTKFLPHELSQQIKSFLKNN